jgi:hypothetical protein
MKRLLSSALFIVVVCFAVNALAETPSTRPDYTISIASPSTRIVAGSEVRLYVTMTNVSDHDISAGTYGESRAELSFDIVAYDSKGNAVPETMYGRTVRNPTRAPIAGSLPPGKSFREYAILNRIVDLSMPETYTIQVRRKNGAHQPEVKSNTLQITIVAP